MSEFSFHCFEPSEISDKYHSSQRTLLFSTKELLPERGGKKNGTCYIRIYNFKQCFGEEGDAVMEYEEETGSSEVIVKQ